MEVAVQPPGCRRPGLPVAPLGSSDRTTCEPGSVVDWVLEGSTFPTAFDERYEDQKRLKGVDQEVMSRVRLKEAQADSLLSWCVEVGERRACAIVENLRRKSYDRAATITAACAEVLRSAVTPSRPPSFSNGCARGSPAIGPFNMNRSRWLRRSAPNDPDLVSGRFADYGDLLIDGALLQASPTSPMLRL